MANGSTIWPRHDAGRPVHCRPDRCRRPSRCLVVVSRVATIWAATLVVATWPVLRWLPAGGRCRWAVTVMTLTLLVLVILPLSPAIGAVVRHADVIASLPDVAANFHYAAAGLALRCPADRRPRRRR